MNALMRSSMKVTKVLTLAATVALASPGAIAAEGAKALEGTWEIVVTVRDCATGAAFRSFPRMVTFHKGGTLSEFAAGGIAAMPATRAPGHGAWEYLGNASFAYSVKFLRLTPFGGPDGNIAETRMVEMGPSGDSFSADGVATITLANGVQIPACATEAGTRLY